MRMAVRVVISLLAVGMWAAAAHAAATEEAGKGPRVVATVNQVDVTYDDFKVRVQLLEQERGPVPPERYGEILRALVREEILYQAAVAQRLDEDASVKRRADVARRQVIVEELLRRKVEAGSRVSDEEARKAYQENQSLFSAETVGVSHIMVKSESDAEAVQAELKAGKRLASRRGRSRRSRRSARCAGRKCRRPARAGRSCSCGYPAEESARVEGEFGLAPGELERFRVLGERDLPALRWGGQALAGLDEAGRLDLRVAPTPRPTWEAPAVWSLYAKAGYRVEESVELAGRELLRGWVAALGAEFDAARFADWHLKAYGEAGYRKASGAYAEAGGKLARER